MKNDMKIIWDNGLGFEIGYHVSGNVYKLVTGRFMGEEYELNKKHIIEYSLERLAEMENKYTI